MKKNLVFLLIIFISLPYCVPPPVKINQRYVIVKCIVGDVFIKKLNENKWKKLKIGERLYLNNIIKTSEKSRCNMQLAQLGTFRLKQNSELILKDLFYDKKTGLEKTELYLQKGKLFVKLKKLFKTESTFNVKTPTATIGVRGTEFLVEVSETSNTKLAVKEGVVEIKYKIIISKEDMDKISRELRNIVLKKVELKESNEIKLKKDTVERIQEIIKENITKGTIERSKISAVAKVVSRELVVRKIKKETRKMLKELNSMEIKENVEEIKGKLIIETEPDEALVYINDVLIGGAPVSMIASVGDVLKVKMIKPGFKTIEKDIQIEKEDTIIKEILEQKLKSGKILWRFKSASAVKTDIISRDNKIYFAGSDGTVYCINDQSEQIWKYTVQQGVSGSPAIYNDLILIGGNDGALYALLKDTGKLSWKEKIGTIVYSKPLISDGILYAGTTEGQLFAINPKSGKKIWQYKAARGIYSTPYRKGNYLFFGCEDSNLYALDIKGNLKWKYQTSKRIVKSSPAAYQDYVFIGNDEGIFYCINIKDGSLKWNYKTGNKISSTPYVSGTKIFISSTDGNLYGFNALDGKLQWKKKIGSKIESSPVIKQGIVYIGSDNGNVYAMQTANGRLLWKALAKGKIYGAVMVTVQHIYAGADTGEIIGIAR